RRVLFRSDVAALTEGDDGRVRPVLVSRMNRTDRDHGVACAVRVGRSPRLFGNVEATVSSRDDGGIGRRSGCVFSNISSGAYEAIWPVLPRRAGIILALSGGKCDCPR